MANNSAFSKMPGYMENSRDQNTYVVFCNKPQQERVIARKLGVSRFFNIKAADTSNKKTLAIIETLVKSKVSVLVEAERISDEIFLGHLKGDYRIVIKH